MGTKVVAAHPLMVLAARREDKGEQSDLEAGMAKYLAGEYCKEVVEEALRHPRRVRILPGVRDRAALPRRAAASHR